MTKCAHKTVRLPCKFITFSEGSICKAPMLQLHKSKLYRERCSDTPFPDTSENNRSVSNPYISQLGSGTSEHGALGCGDHRKLIKNIAPFQK